MPASIIMGRPKWKGRSNVMSQASSQGKPTDPSSESATPRPLALVTGGARRLGRTLALALAQNGYAIGLHYHTSTTEAQHTAEEIRALGMPVYLLQADLRDEKAIADLFARLDTWPHPLRVLVNSAAVMTRRAIRDLSLTQWNETLALNLTAPFLCARYAAERMRDGGLILNITDVGAHRAWSSFPDYVVSKAALEALTRVLARAYAPHIRVNALAPGLVFPSEDMPPEEWERLINRLPLQRPAKESEIAAALEFLLKNEYLTGQTVIVDGGYSLL